MWLDHLLSREHAYAGVKSEKAFRSKRLWRTKHYDGDVEIFDFTGANSSNGKVKIDDNILCNLQRIAGAENNQ